MKQGITVAPLSRRGFLAGAGIAAAAAASGAFLGGCAPAQEKGGNSVSEDVAWVAADSADETVECDFVVVGGGMAGFTAALTAAQEGCGNIVLLEKNSSIGGSTQYAEGVFGNGSSYQIEQGYTPAEADEILAEELEWSHWVVNQSLMKQYIAAAPDYIEWMMDQGVKFIGVIGDPAQPVMHHYEGGNGKIAVNLFSDLCQDQYGVDVRTSTPATALLLEGDTVIGVQSKTNSKTINFVAPSVLIATGGISSSEDMMDEYTRQKRGSYRHFGNAGLDGDGHKMVEVTKHGRAKDVCSGNMWLNVDGSDIYGKTNFIGGMEGSNIWVNEHAERFVNEDIATGFFTANNVVASQGRAYSILDDARIEWFAENGVTFPWSGFTPFMTPIEGLREDLDASIQNDSVMAFRADSLEELASQIDLDAVTLADTVARWNASIEKGEDEQFGKAPQYFASVSQPPYYAFKLTNGVLNTIGGIRVDSEARVLGIDGTVVEGLYAAGVACSGFSGEVYSGKAGGTGQGSAVWLGRVAGMAAAQRAS